MMMNKLLYLSFLFLLSCFGQQDKKVVLKKEISVTLQKNKITLAGGCFWGVEELFKKFPGVVSTDVGYTGGHLKNPRYEDIKKGNTGHAEAVQITYDDITTDLAKLLDYFFRLHDPTTLNQQGNDKGTQYRSAIFYLDEDQKKMAQEAVIRAQNSKRWKDKIVTEVVAASDFYLAEDFHQDYLQKNPAGYTCHFLRK